MAKKYEGGWGIRARKNLKLVDSNIWLSPKGKLTTIDKAKRFDTRDGAYQYLDYAPDLSCPLDDWFDFAVDKLPVKSSGCFGIQNRSGKWLIDEIKFGDKKDAWVFYSYEDALKELCEEDGEYITPITDTPLNPNPDCPWDVVFDHVIPPSCEPGDLYDENWFPLDTGFTYKKVDDKSKEGKMLLELIYKLFGIQNGTNPKNH